MKDVCCKMKDVLLTFSFVLGIFCGVQCQHSDYYTGIKNLKSAVAGHDPWVRFNEEVNLSISFNLMNIHEMNTEDPSLISNTAVLDQTSLKVTLYHTGTLVWEPGVQTRVFCEADLMYYPYDHQTCHLTVATGSQTGEETPLYPLLNSVYLGQYSRDDFEEQASSQNRKIGRLSYTINLRRNASRFYWLMVFVPVILLSAVSLLTFLLPADGNEKATFPIITLLIYVTFYLSLLQDIPCNNQITILSAYGFTVLLLIVLETACAILCIWVSLRQETHEVSKQTRNFILGLANLVCINFDMEDNGFTTSRASVKTEPPVKQDFTLDHSIHPVDMVQMPPIDTSGQGQKTANGHIQPRRRLSPLRNRVTPDNAVRPKSNSSVRSASRPSSYVSVRSVQRSTRLSWSLRRPTWHQLSVCLDRLFCFIFMFINVIVHVSFLMVLALA
ncbi:ACH10-like protein [Mya arenaria]|uniref:ACH10-like protein n=1 Tax=Mya arenaria TaxID=6604 RepID=A0ABY7DHZ3_MYAAR|nr:ACH10-like protein [Mya arenaria]